MRVIARKERPHPGAQLRLTDVDGCRITAFATNTLGGQLADLELRHRRRARCEDRIRLAKDTGLGNLPLHGFAQNQIWCAIVMLAVELTPGCNSSPWNHQARRWEPKRLRYRLFSLPAALARSGRSLLLHLTERSPWAGLVADAIARLRALAVPGRAPHPPPRRPESSSRTTGTRTTRGDLGRTVTPTQQNQNPVPAARPEP